MNARAQIAEIAQDLIKRSTEHSLSLEFSIGEGFEIILSNQVSELVLELKESFVQTKDLKEYRYCLSRLENNDCSSHVTVVQVSTTGEVSYIEGNPLTAIVNHFSGK